MSHFTVLVIGNNPKQQLAPYQENNMGDCPKEFLKFNDHTEEVLQEWESDRAGYSDIDTFAAEYCGYPKDLETGKYGYYENPNAKWDWYELGGRWTGFFLLKQEPVLQEVGRPGLMTTPVAPGQGRADRCLARDVDWEAMKFARRLEAQKDWDDFQTWLAAGSPRSKIPYFEFGVDFEDGQPETYEEFMTRRTTVTTYALVKDGAWCERGEMGWFASISNEKDPEVWYKQFAMIIDSLDGNEMLSLYDCHI